MSAPPAAPAPGAASVPPAPTRDGTHDRADVLGCAVDRLDMAATVARVERALERREFVQHMALNAAKLVALRDDAALRDAVEHSDLVTADGQSLVWASRLLGDPLPERVTGIDLMHELMGLAARRGAPIYLLGARAEVLETAIARLREQHPGLVVAGSRDGYFPASEDAAVAAAIRAARPELVFVAMTSPRKEVFLARHGTELGAPFVMGVGGAIDVVAGVTSRAPRWMQRTGLEWLHRLVQEPRRMFLRYLRSNTRFLALLAGALVRRGGRRRAGSSG